MRAMVKKIFYFELPMKRFVRDSTIGVKNIFQYKQETSTTCKVEKYYFDKTASFIRQTKDKYTYSYTPLHTLTVLSKHKIIKQCRFIYQILKLYYTW